MIKYIGLACGVVLFFIVYLPLLIIHNATGYAIDLIESKFGGLHSGYR